MDRRALLIACVLGALTGCRTRSEKHVDAGGAPRGGDIQPTYPKSSGPVSPLATRLCRIMHGHAADRRAECCHGRPSVIVDRVIAECERNLNGALSSKAIEIDLAALDGCEADLKARLAGCDWVGPLPPASPARCASALRGLVKAGAPCRSSLECEGVLRCEGAGPTEAGRCAPAGQLGHACRTAVDPLASFVGDETLEVTHPECRGWCERHRCVGFVAEAQACTSPSQCGPDRHCADRRCVAGARAEEGGACTGGGCADGTRCHQGRCIRPHADGACTSDFECAGACVKQLGAAEGRCAMDCTRS